MTTPTAFMAEALASSISHAAFRVLHVLALHMNSGWVDIPPIAEKCRMTPHQIRLPLAELREVHLIEHERRYETGATGRKTWHTYVRLVDDSTSEAAV
ncbi:hypothetical protein ACGFR8_31185 [Streptomyces brevispora]|uniref:hypothetical protein n=1 Tax=Streptomyces brevispora TaxID=887462 RepID=UPI0037197069